MGRLERYFAYSLCLWLFAGVLLTAGCAQVSIPDVRTPDIPTPQYADSRRKAVNERPDSVMYLPLGEDVLVPEVDAGSKLPMDHVGPFELRSETLAGALQLILADYDISLAFESEEGLTRRITVANLRGSLDSVVNRVCGLADLYCSFEEGMLVVKDTQTFTVSLPPIGASAEDSEFLDNVIEGLKGILGAAGTEPIADPTTRTIVYSATQRTADLAARYFQRLRANTALIVFETYIWEVQLNSGNSTGIDWDRLQEFGKFNTSIAINGSIDSDFTNPVSIGLPTTQNIGGAPTDLVQFLSQFGAVKSISQPQITVLSGSEASLRVADTENYVSEISTTIDEGQATTSVSTDTVDSGFEMAINSSWDKSTVYANVNLNLTNVIDIANFTFSDSGDDNGTDTTIQLPQTSERELNTNIRVRPGDSILIAGLVREDDKFNSRGPGIMKPILPDSRTASVDNLELVILLRPRVIVYTPHDDLRYQAYVTSKQKNNELSAVTTPSAQNTASAVSKRTTVSVGDYVSSIQPAAGETTQLRQTQIFAPLPSYETEEYLPPPSAIELSSLGESTLVPMAQTDLNQAYFEQDSLDPAYVIEPQEDLKTSFQNKILEMESNIRNSIPLPEPEPVQVAKVDFETLEPIDALRLQDVSNVPPVFSDFEAQPIGQVDIFEPYQPALPSVIEAEPIEKLEVFQTDQVAWAPDVEIEPMQKLDMLEAQKVTLPSSVEAEPISQINILEPERTAPPPPQSQLQKPVREYSHERPSIVGRVSHRVEEASEPLLQRRSSSVDVSAAVISRSSVPLHQSDNFDSVLESLQSNSERRASSDSVQIFELQDIGDTESSDSVQIYSLEQTLIQ